VSDQTWIAILVAGNLALITMCGLTIYIVFWRPNVARTFFLLADPILVILDFIMALGYLVIGQYLASAWFAFWAITIGWRWWKDKNNRKRRKKLLERGAGFVVDIGGRLKVVRPATISI
jgi:hypothetical protein